METLEAFWISNAAVGGELVNVAVQDLAALIVRMPSEQSASPVQLVKVDPAEGAAVNVTDVPEL